MSLAIWLCRVIGFFGAMLQELPTMGKKHTKSEKLDLMLSELKGMIKKLLTEQAADAKQGAKVRSKSTQAPRGKMKKRTAVRKKPPDAVAPSKPALAPTTPDAGTG
jgi:septal ring factor EnvC (AmiA/AmiB activator)